MSGSFQWEDCLLKHYVRRQVWLPSCQRQKGLLTGKNPRRLKYFTFCAVGALDVLLLDREKVIRRSNSDEFDTVFFFDRDADHVDETRKRIPGARGFPGDFVEVLLDTSDDGGLNSPTLSENTKEVRRAQRYQAQRKTFFGAFPFDVMNLDVEGYFFKPSEELPGKLAAALRKILELQKQEGLGSNKKPYSVDRFTLFFTTKVGPRNLSADYLDYLREISIKQNIADYSELDSLFLKKSGGRKVEEFFDEDLDEALKLAVPKSLADLAVEADWFVDSTFGIEVLEFDRDSKEGPYTMLHLAMTLRRQNPPKERRLPQRRPAEAETEHRKVVNQIFDRDVVNVGEMIQGDLQSTLSADLVLLFEHRKKFYLPLDEET